MKKLFLLILPAFIILTNATSQSCLPLGIKFKSQQQINNFQNDYPNCTKIEGSVFFDGEDIKNVNGLENLTAIEGNLLIDGHICRVPLLTSLKGFKNLETIEGSLRISQTPSLTYLTGLEKLTSIGGELLIGIVWPKSTDGNCSLKSLAGLNNLLSVGRGVYIGHNKLLDSLYGLDKLIFVGGDFIIRDNSSLKNLNSLQTLTQINGAIEIYSNPVLENINGITNIDPESIHYLRIRSNPSLAFCEAEFICNYLSNLEEGVSIFNNAKGCNNEVEVMKACGNPTSIDTVQIENSFSAYPNPFITSTTITFGLQQPTTVQLFINDLMGRRIIANEYILTEGNTEIIWDANSLPYGTYYCTLKTDDKFETLKLLKMK